MIWNEIMAYPCLSLIASPSSSRSNTSLFHVFCTYSHLFYPSLSLLTTFRGYLRNGLIAPAPSIIRYGQSDMAIQTSVGDSSPTSLSPTLTIPLLLHLFTSTLFIPSTLIRFPGVLRNGAISPSTTYNTIRTFCRYLSNTRASSITDITLSYPHYSIT